MGSELDVAGTFIPSLYKPSSLLPIARHRHNLLYLIETSPITIVVGQTGSGKTTQIPQFLEKAGVSPSEIRCPRWRSRLYLLAGDKEISPKVLIFGFVSYFSIANFMTSSGAPMAR